MAYQISLIKGDGIGPEIMDATVFVLEKLAQKRKLQFDFVESYAGGQAFDKTNDPLPDETIFNCKQSQAVLLGAVGGPKWDHLPSDKRPEKALLKLRKELGLYANIRPAMMYDALKDACPLKAEIVSGGLDIVIVRELTGGIYFGKKESSHAYACDHMEYWEYEVARIVEKAFKIAQLRKNKLTSVDKANVLETSKLWRRTIEKIHKKYPEVELEHMYVDNAAMQLVINPQQFDVIVTENMFGDILSDEASMITGSIGMLPSASLGDKNFGLYEPIHGSAPDIAGQNIANPIASILSAAMMLRMSLSLEEEALLLERAVETVLNNGWRTKDISNGMEYIGTDEMARKIADQITEA